MKTISGLRGSFMARVALLALTSGLLVLAGLIFIVGSLSAAPTGLKLGLVAVVVIALPIALGWLTRRLIMRPLSYLADAISAMQSSSAKASIKPSGINEFDAILARFQHLTSQLHQEEELRKNLISDTSHELNTPLAVMTGQLIAMQESKLPITPERIAVLTEQTERLTALVSGLDAYSRARMPRQAGVENIHVRKMCQQLLDELSPQIKVHSLQVRLDIPATLVVPGDRQAFQQILHNWLENVLRYSGAAQARIIADKYGITLTDNGQGVSDKDLPHLFERFYRVEKSRNRSTGGLGLGLAITKELVERQGWTIRVEAAQPGLAFVITFTA